jgi:hypothetical protein
LNNFENTLSSIISTSLQERDVKVIRWDPILYYFVHVVLFATTIFDKELTYANIKNYKQNLHLAAMNL